MDPTPAQDPGFWRGALAFLASNWWILAILLVVVRPLLSAIQDLLEKKPPPRAGDDQFRDEVFPRELAYLADRQASAGSSGRRPSSGSGPSVSRGLFGLALSGGGIRSSTFNLGLLQALHSRGIFRHVDYLSTVSGGGFIGGCLTTLMSGKGGTETGRFPFTHQRRAGEAPAVEYLRNHARYLAPSGGLDWLRMVWAWGRGIVLNALVVLPWIAFVAAAVGTLVYQDLREAHDKHLTIPVQQVERQLGQIATELLSGTFPPVTRRVQIAAEQPDGGEAPVEISRQFFLFDCAGLGERTIPTSDEIRGLILQLVARQLGPVLQLDAAKLEALAVELLGEVEELSPGAMRFSDRFAAVADLIGRPDAELAAILANREAQARDARLVLQVYRGHELLADLLRLDAADLERLFPAELTRFNTFAAQAGLEPQALRDLLWLGTLSDEALAGYVDRFGTESDAGALRIPGPLLEIALEAAGSQGRFVGLVEEARAAAVEALAALPALAETTAEELLQLGEQARTDPAVLAELARKIPAGALELGQVRGLAWPLRDELLKLRRLGGATSIFAGFQMTQIEHPFDWSLFDGRLTVACLRFAVPLIFLFAILYMRRSGAGRPLGWRSSLRLAISFGMLFALSFLAFPAIWTSTFATDLLWALVLIPIALPILERLLSQPRPSWRLTDLKQVNANLMRRRTERLSTALIALIGVTLVIDLQQPIIDYFHHFVFPVPEPPELFLGLLGLFAALLVLGSLPAQHPVSIIGSRVLMTVLAAAGLSAMLLLYLWIADRMIYGSAGMPVGSPLTRLEFGVIAVVLFFAAYELDHLFNANDSSMNSFYRDRLNEAYLIGEDKDRALGPEDDLPLAAICPDGSGAPYHLINAAVNLQASGDVSLRGRNSDFFVFSRDSLGGPRVGYCRNDEITDVYGPVHLGTAMAVSAAAASPNMGTFTVSGLTPLLTLLNVRLGYWLPHPGKMRHYRDLLVQARRESSGRARRLLGHLAYGLRRSRLQPGGNLLWSEIFGRLHERGSAVNVSDGGHLENLGAYELLRRRCRFILVSDAESDPGMRAGALAALMRYARIDLGIDIKIFLDNLVPDAKGYCRQHCAVGRILYPPSDSVGPEVGILLYVKSSVTDDEDLVVGEYRAAHPDFPHESTADQFFHEDQFEAYRSLGFHIIAALLDDRTEIGDFTDLVDWVEELAVRLAPAAAAAEVAPDVGERLRALDELLERPEMARYFREIYPERASDVEAASAVETSDQTRRQILIATTHQLAIMADVYEALRLGERRNRQHPAHRGWMGLFRRWAGSPHFRRAYLTAVTRYPTRFQFFCERVLGLELELAWTEDGADGERLVLHASVEGAAGEPLEVGTAAPDGSDLKLITGYDSDEISNRARRLLRRRPDGDAA